MLRCAMPLMLHSRVGLGHRSFPRELIGDRRSQSRAWSGRVTACRVTNAAVTMATTEGRAAAATGIVLLTLAAGQFVMALDTTVMNTAIATVAEDLDTTVTGIQTAIT